MIIIEHRDGVTRCVGGVYPQCNPDRRHSHRLDLVLEYPVYGDGKKRFDVVWVQWVATFANEQVYRIIDGTDENTFRNWYLEYSAVQKL